MAKMNQDPGKTAFFVEGSASIEGASAFPAELALEAYVFDRAGQTLGSAAVGKDGSYNVPVRIAGPTDVQLVLGPPDEPQTARRSASFSRSFGAAEFKGGRISADLVVARDVVSLWWPQTICISGHVRKIFQQDGITDTCPVPFVKVEIFDVDRENCWWPYLRRWWDLVIDRPVFRIPELLEERPIPKPFPWPDPDPGPKMPAGFAPPSDAFAFNPQPDPPHLADVAFRAAPLAASTASAASAFAARIEKLTLTSRLAPWLIFPWCFYSRQLVCETTTDNCGYFRCCFPWWPFHVRQGRFRFDARPDVIIKVTQVINGVETVIYLDPYSSTRWNVGSAHVDLFLDNQDVQCGSCDGQVRPEGTAVFLTRIGNDEVYRINQATGTYSRALFPPTTNMAYGSGLRVHAQFGDTLSRAMAIPGATAPYYYSLSRSTDGLTFTPITADMVDTRVDKLTLMSESHTLGPQTVGATTGLFEVRDFGDYYWYNPDWIGYWNTVATESDSDVYTLRLEVFDATGAKLDSTKVDYRDGTQPPPAVLPPMAHRCDLKIAIDNKPPVVALDIPAAINDCGVVPWASAGSLAFGVSASQENGRLNRWHLEYTKGLNAGANALAGGTSNSGAPSSVAQTVSGAPLVSGLTTTCAFAVKLYAWAHIRNGYGLVYYREVIKAIAVEKCD